ncbi:thiamine-phosphate diphosphorylase / hydroxyethylthiazole kinase, partial [Lecanoromycetidae sp. Uapishka_2]
MPVNYSLYLVTDSTPAILGNKDIVSVVEAAIEGGVTIVQFRDKKSDTADLIRIGKRLHAVTKRNNVPLLINDHVDVAQAIGTEGVHLGQGDMDLQTARRILGPDAIIGVTANNLSEAVLAASGGADYLGIGTVYATPTKENTKTIIGPAGVKDILHRLSSIVEKIPTVAIGGINASNVQRVMFQSKSSWKGLDGVAIVSAIMGAEDPKAAAAALRKMITEVPTTMSSKAKDNNAVESLLKQVPDIVKALGIASPLCHNMTNLVVQNLAANVALCIGASPIMANYGEEAKDLAGLGGALVINMGTVTPDGLSNYTKAMRSYNEVGGPVLLDPVGAGATAIRRDAVKTLMSNGYFDVIKGNENEIRTVLGESVEQQKGVDSGTSSSDETEKIRLVKKLATRERNVVLMTGKTDYLSDGERAYAVTNGHLYLGKITGSGCTLGTTIAAFLAVHREDKLLAALAGILMYEIAAEQAAAREDVKGPGTFVPAFLDQLYLIAADASQRESRWLKAAKVEKL